MLTSLAVVKEHVLIVSTGMWVRVQDENTAIVCKRTANLKDTNSRDKWTRIKTQNAMSTEMRRYEIQTKPISVISMQQL